MHKCRYRRFLLTLGVGLLLFAGVAQAQSHHGETNFQSSETKADANYLQPWQPCLNADQEGIKGSLQEERRQSSKTVNVPIINKPKSKDKDKKAALSGNTGPKSDSSGPSSKKYGIPITEDMGPQVGSVGSLPTSRGSMQSTGLGSSFLDGYFLNSLQDKGRGRKKEAKEKKLKDDLPKRVKRVF
jgi:hypothetical protein